jgi:hypothetical protein
MPTEQLRVVVAVVLNSHIRRGYSAEQLPTRPLVQPGSAVSAGWKSGEPECGSGCVMSRATTPRPPVRIVVSATVRHSRGLTPPSGEMKTSLTAIWPSTRYCCSVP